MNKDELKEFIKEIKYKPPVIDMGDFHSVNSAAIFGDKFIELLEDNPKEAKQLRKKGKSSGLAILYGSSAYGLAQGLNISKEEAQDIIDNFYNGLSVLNKVHKYQEKIVYDKGVAVGLYGQIRYLPFATKKITDKEKSDPKLRKVFFSRKSLAGRLAKNYPIQSSGSVIIILLTIKLNKWIEQHKMNRHFGNLMWQYKPYTRIISIEEQYEDTINEVDSMPEGIVKVLITNKDKIVGEIDQNKTIKIDFLEQHKDKIKIVW